MESVVGFGLVGLVLVGHWLADLNLKRQGKYQELLIVNDSQRYTPIAKAPQKQIEHSG